MKRDRYEHPPTIRDLGNEAAERGVKAFTLLPDEPRPAASGREG